MPMKNIRERIRDFRRCGWS